MARDEMDSSWLTLGGLLAALTTFLLILASQALYQYFENEETLRKAASGPPERLRDLVSEERERIGAYRLLDRKKMTVAIPIERAMELTVRDLAKAPAVQEGAKP